MTLFNFIKALIGGLLWAFLCWLIIKFVGVNGGEDDER